LSCKNDAFARMVQGIYEVLLRTHQTPEQTPSQSAFSAFLPCPHNCIFEDSTGHNGPVRARKTNLSVLVSETMWYQPILIEHLTVLLLLQQHAHFSSSRRVSMWTLVVENVVDADIYETSDCSKSSSEPFEKCILQIVHEIRILVPKLFVSLVQKFGEQDQKLKKKILFVPFFEKVEISPGISYVPG
jgi:hypothetical protein